MVEVPLDGYVRAILALLAFLWLAFRLHIAWRVEQRHERESERTAKDQREAVERAVRYGKQLGRAELRASMRRATDASDERLHTWRPS